MNKLFNSPKMIIHYQNRLLLAPNFVASHGGDRVCAEETANQTPCLKVSIARKILIVPSSDREIYVSSLRSRNPSLSDHIIKIIAWNVNMLSQGRLRGLPHSSSIGYQRSCDLLPMRVSELQGRKVPAVRYFHRPFESPFHIYGRAPVSMKSTVTNVVTCFGTKSLKPKLRQSLYRLLII